MYLQQAKQGYTDWWRYVLIFLVMIVLSIIASLYIPHMYAIIKNATGGNANWTEYKTTLDPKSLGLSLNGGLLLMVAPLSIVFAGLVIAIKYLYGYSWIQVFTSHPKFRWKHFFISALVWFILLGIVDLVYYMINPAAYTFQFNASVFFQLVLISIIFFPFQTAWEELYFRGNLMQGFGLLSKSRLGALLITSVLFGASHVLNPEVEKYGAAYAMAQYIGFGILLSITVIMDGGLEMAFGVHAVNNIYSAVFVSYSGSVLNTEALISANHDKVYMTISFLAAAIIFLLLIKYAFKWKSFRWLAESL